MSPLSAEWFVGFCDGEGSLGIAGHGGSLQPRFRINLRDDDGDLIRAIRDFVGVGAVFVKRTDPNNPLHRNQISVSVAGADCMRLVSIFDSHPLRSKKRFEYPIWREATVIYAANIGGRWKPGVVAGRIEKLSQLKTRLEAARRYEGPR